VIFGLLGALFYLVFNGSQMSIIESSDRLREMAETQHLPNEFFAHHGNLAKSERELVESRLRDDPRPTTAVAMTN